jgi:hypothetical protein
MNPRLLASRVLVALAILFLAVPREAEAAAISIESLESLAFEATAVVYATRLSTVDAGSYAVASTYRVEKTYAGELRTGDTVTVDDHAYPSQGPFGEETIADDSKRVLFLERRGADAKSWSIVSTGVRLISAGRVYRFYQYMNPGGLTPAREGEGKARGPITLAAFERKLAAALSRAARDHVVLAASHSAQDRAAFRRACLDLLGPPVLPRDANPDGDSLIAEKMLRALVDDKDVEGAIEVLARTPHTSVTGFPLGAVRDALPRTIALARDPARPIAVRVAAIEALHTFTAFDERYDAASLVPLLSDRSPDIRIAAVEAIAAEAGHTPPRKGQPEKSRNILWDAWKKEKDVWVKLAFVKTLHWLDKSHAVLPLRDPLFAAREDGEGRLEVDYFAPLTAGAPGIPTPEVHYAATDVGGGIHQGNLEDLKGQGFSYGTASGGARIDLPLEPGVYGVTITAKFDFDGMVVVRSARIDDFKVAPSPSLDAPAGDPVDASTPDIPRGARGPDAPTVRPPRGCHGCAASEPEATVSVFLGPILVLALVMRRAKRS